MGIARKIFTQNTDETSQNLFPKNLLHATLFKQTCNGYLRALPQVYLFICFKHSSQTYEQTFDSKFLRYFFE